ncbi:hypothetical protein [Ruegeria atlantica]|uniref:hypothetical protein n=1 Tax=Ruegeria atlantica TaxID=81569 RepID=UPI00147AD6D1|nr:hypothetical protein [Ruegeria atlantica]
MFFKSKFGRMFKSRELAGSVKEDLAEKAQTAKSGAVNKSELTALFGDVLNDSHVRSGESRRSASPSQK